MPKKKTPKKNASAKKGGTRHNRKDDEHRYSDFENEIRDLGLSIRSTKGDGNCLFRAISDQMFNNEDAHRRIRKDVCDYIERNRTEYESFVEEDVSFDGYVEGMRHTGTYGGNLELAAFAKMAGCDIKVYQPGLIYVIPGRPSDHKGKRITHHLAYYDWEHYASIGTQPGNNSIPKDQPLPDRYKQFHDMENIYPDSPVMDSFEIKDSVESLQDDIPEPVESTGERKKTSKIKKRATSEKKLSKSKTVATQQKAAATDGSTVQEPDMGETGPSKEPRTISRAIDENDAQDKENEADFKQTEMCIKKSNDQDEENENDESVKRKKHTRKKAVLTRQEEKKLKKLAKLKRQEQLEPSTDANYQDDDRLPDGMKLLYI